jgi:hypothetical protein
MLLALMTLSSVALLRWHRGVITWDDDDIIAVAHFISTLMMLKRDLDAWLGNSRQPVGGDPSAFLR